jgi:uncharacterized protein (TIGR03067 family)
MAHPVLILLAATLPYGSDDPRTAATDRDRLQGTWTCVRMERNGKEIPRERYRDGILIIEGDKFTYKQGDRVMTAGTRTLDPNRSPKAVDDTHTLGPFKGKSYKGIYRLEGDTFTTCNGGAGQARPSEFATKSGSGLLLVVYKRALPPTPSSSK